jgi:hypothetical protein
MKKLLTSILVISLTSCVGGAGKDNLTETDEASAVPFISSLDVYIENPIYQDITRAVFFESNSETNLEKIIFSTLESYKPDGSDHNFLMVSSKEVSSGVYDSEIITIGNSREARNCTSAGSLGQYFCGSSLSPKIIKLNADVFNSEILYSDDAHSGWVHGMAFDRNSNLYFISSSNVYLPGGVIKIDSLGNLLSTIPYIKSSTQTYGGVDLIDQNGTIWLWKGYPWKQIFLLPDGSEVDRNIDGYSAEGYEEINGNIYHIYVNKNGNFNKRKIVDTFSDERLDSFINVDLQFRSNKNSKVVYFDQSSNYFYIFNRNTNSWSGSILNQFGEPKTEFMFGSDKEVPLLWIHPKYGKIQIIGATQNNQIIGWLYGRKSFFLISDEGKIKHEIGINNRSPAEITALTVLDNIVYGAGNLTWNNMFSYSSGELATHKEAIPNNEGQIDLLFNGGNGYIYGMGYPGAKAFRYDPDLDWDPGNSITSNPKNCGEVKGQTRGIIGFHDSKNLFYVTESDYSAIKTTVLSNIDMSTCSITSRSDSEKLFPTIIDITNFGDGELLSVGDSDGSAMLMIINKNDLNVINTMDIYGESHTLFTGNYFTKPLIGIDSSVCIVEYDLELSSCSDLRHPALKIYELGSYALIFGLKDLTIIDGNLNIVNSYTAASLGLNEFFPYLSLMHVAIHANEVYFSNYASVYKITFNSIN